MTRVHGVDGFRFLCHVWVVAYHCLPTLPAFDRFLGNGDSGVFFTLTGFVTDLSLSSYIAVLRPGRPKLAWLYARLFRIALVTWLIALVSYMIFPIKAGRGSHLVWYVLTFTLP